MENNNNIKNISSISHETSVSSEDLAPTSKEVLNENTDL